MSTHTMSFTTEYVVLSILGCIFLAFTRLSTWRPSLKQLHGPYSISSLVSPRGTTLEAKNKSSIEDTAKLVDCHETAARLMEMIHKDGAGTWPPHADYVYSSWPTALRPYMDVYNEMAPLLPAAIPSTDDEVNAQRIASFRSRFETLLAQRVNLDEVTELLEAADSGRWDVFPRDVYNAFYCCVAWCRHAYRWGTIPAVRVAQLEKTVSLPPELTSTWASLQSHFGLNSDSGNMMSNIILNFSRTGTYALHINTGLSPVITTTEREFSVICRDVEAHAVPIYRLVILATLCFERGDKLGCLSHLQDITAHLRPLLNGYYSRLHDSTVARSAWLSHVQGFFAWGAGREDEESGEWDKFDGLSGNQILLFQVLDAFLGLPVYLPRVVLERNVPVLQRRFCEAVQRASFRSRLGNQGVDAELNAEFAEIVKRLRLFRSAHRTRAKFYLMVPAPERLPMTAGKSLLKEDMEKSFEYLDEFMVGRLQQTV